MRKQQPVRSGWLSLLWVCTGESEKSCSEPEFFRIAGSKFRIAAITYSVLILKFLQGLPCPEPGKGLN